MVDDRLVGHATGGRPLDRSRPAVVMIHGAGMDKSVFATQARALAHRGRSVLALDLPGHGGSAGPPLDDVPAMAAWLLRAMTAAGIERAALAGHSMGSLVALAAAAMAPERVRALALISTAMPMRVSPALLEAARQDPPRARRMIVAFAYAPAARLGGSPTPGLWLPLAGLRLLERCPDEVLARDLAACAAFANGLDLARTLSCPTRLVLGAHDRMTPPAAAEALAAAITSARTVILPDVGHMPMVEAPPSLLAALTGVV